MRWEQYEIWEQQQDGGRWEMTSAWRDFDVASAVARNKTARLRLIHAFYEDSQPVQADVLVELGATRKEG